MPRYVTTARIAGMRSVHCARAVYTALAALPGVATAEVVVGQATIEHDAPLDEAQLRDAIALAGYALVGKSEERQRTLPLL